ncbi:hypothetical protein Moror_15320 [Moniliophthora roreri MCA 2997]|uniref:Uncharacterized protein n=2 Tax=Moniliophthora roreri TaxID=221103 RepID=V2X1X7_MONRO|nr:hypothetical protein Moror_15320 [Moniliophthora roreri MCA 2997]
MAQCYRCLAQSINSSDFRQPQQNIDGLVTECVMLGFTMEKITLPGQDPNRPLATAPAQSSPSQTSSGTRTSTRPTSTAPTSTAPPSSSTGSPTPSLPPSSPSTQSTTSGTTASSPAATSQSAGSGNNSASKLNGQNTMFFALVSIMLALM